MADPVPPGVPPAHPQPPQMEVPTFRAPDVQFLIQDLAQSRRDLFEERKNSANRLAEERERSRWEIERVRLEYGGEIKSLNSENEALVRAIGRVQKETDRLREENAILRLSKSNGHVEEKSPAAAPAEKQDIVSAFNRAPGGTTVPLVPGGRFQPRGPSAQVMPPPQVIGGGPQIIAPGAGPV